MTKPAEDPQATTPEAAHERVKGWRDDPEAKKPKDHNDRSNEADEVKGET